MAKYVVVAYRASNEVYSCNCLMDSSSSDFDIFDSLEEDEVVETTAKYLSQNAVTVGVEGGYDINIILGGEIVHALACNDNLDSRGKGVVDNPGSRLGSSPLLDKILARAAVLLAEKREGIAKKAAEKACAEKAWRDDEEKSELKRLLEKHPEVLK